jgi:preprotein translocase subunit YajC
MTLVYLVIFFALIYFFMLRPQQKAQKQRQNMINTIAPGAEVVTIGGLHGKVSSVDNDARTFELDAEGIVLVFDLTAIRTVVTAAPEAATADDAPAQADETEAEVASEAPADDVAASDATESEAK